MTSKFLEHPHFRCFHIHHTMLYSTPFNFSILYHLRAIAWLSWMKHPVYTCRNVLICYVLKHAFILICILLLSLQLMLFLIYSNLWLGKRYTLVTDYSPLNSFSNFRYHFLGLKYITYWILFFFLIVLHNMHRDAVNYRYDFYQVFIVYIFDENKKV